ncbi:MAG: hypothetical protein M1358_25600 [Chloroflexi bacterium]|nr:hypothetical protein [Chloroflexota bacterium]
MKIERHRRSIRLKGFDYTQPGAYFVTICSLNRECLLGEIVNGEMQISECGFIVRKTWENLPQHYINVALDAFVVMPNHVHGIIVLLDEPNPVGAGLKPAPGDGALDKGAGLKPAPTSNGPLDTAAGSKPAPTDDGSTALAKGNPRGLSNDYPPYLARHHLAASTITGTNRLTAIVGAGLKPAPTTYDLTGAAETESAIRGEAVGRHGLPEIVRAFKTFSARRVNEYRQSAGVPVWQRNYYEHVIRNDQALDRIREYIQSNPLRWQLDSENPLARGKDEFDEWLTGPHRRHDDVSK